MGESPAGLLEKPFWFSHQPLGERGDFPHTILDVPISSGVHNYNPHYTHTHTVKISNSAHLANLPISLVPWPLSPGTVLVQSLPQAAHLLLVGMGGIGRPQKGDLQCEGL